jgi:hypothetical protein
MTQLSERTNFPVPLSFSAHGLANRLRQSNPQKAKQIYLNTLAVYAVDFYLRCLGIETELEKSDSQNSACLKFMDVADLQVKSIGKVECRPVLPGATELEIPVEVREDRVGYMAVQFDRSLREANIIGFATTAAASIPLSQLHSIDAFPEYLEHLQSPVRVKTNLRQRIANYFEEDWQELNSILNPAKLAFRSPPKAETNLRQWIANYFEEGWQELNSILNPAKLPVRSFPTAEASLTVGKEKRIQLITPEETINLILVTEVHSYSENAMHVRASISPNSDRSALPAAVQVRIINEQGNVETEEIAGEDRLKMELLLTVESGEHFTLQIGLGETSVNENFVA